LGIALVAVVMVEIALIFLLLPRIGQALQGAVSDALVGGMITIFGMGTSASSVVSKNYGGLFPGLVITGVGGWMMVAAIKKMSEGE
jgi:hypothetical protein